MLTYTHIVSLSPIIVTEEKELTAPVEWSMFSTAGNHKLTKISKKLLASVDTNRSYKHYVKQINSFITAYTNMSFFKKYREASDFVVREIVYEFLLKVEHALGHTYLNNIWNNI